MIVNVPSSDDLLHTSLRLYFKAWSEVTTIITEWIDFSGRTPEATHPERKTKIWEFGAVGEEDWKAYLEGAQSDLQGIYTLIQQSQEIGLKGLIAEVSPFLLLEKHDASPLTNGGKEFDFTDFPTHDAANLIRIHDTFCKRSISKPFVEIYDEIRRARNKISHLGIFDPSLDPMAMIEVLIRQYREFYPDRTWMEDRLEFAALHRWSAWVDGDDIGWNDRTALLHELWRLLPAVSEETFEFLIKHPRLDRRYVCVFCTTEAKLGDSEPYEGDIPTAYRVPDTHTVLCSVCDGSYVFVERVCPRNECDGDLASGEPESVNECLTCGWGTDEEDDREKGDETSSNIRRLVAGDPP